MDFQYSVLVFSKYSSGCKRLFDIVKNSGLDFDKTFGNKLQLLCVDNEEIRKRIKGNKQLDITSVPCILCIYPNGGVEKYDGNHAFLWIENLIEKYAPPVQQSQQIQQLQQPQQIQQLQQPQQIQPHQIQPPQQQLEDEEDELMETVKQYKKSQKKVKIPSRMKPISTEEVSTPISDIPIEDDRHRTPKQPKRIQQDTGEYIEDDSFFQGGDEEERIIPKTKSSEDPHGVRAKADELARGRDDIDKQFGRPPMDRRA